MYCRTLTKVDSELNVWLLLQYYYYYNNYKYRLVRYTFQLVAMLMYACRERGLVVHDIEAGGRISQDGRIHVKDRIIEINGVSLIGASFQRYVFIPS